MDPIVVLLASASGALIGTAVGILLFRRKMRPPITDAELAALKSKVQAGDSSLATATANIEDLRKQIALQEKTLLQNGEDLKKKQQQIDAEVAETQKERTLRSVAEQNVQDLGSKTQPLKEQCAKLEAQVKEAQSLVASKATRLASVDAELEAGKRKIQDLTEQTAQLTSESVELKGVVEKETRLRTMFESQLNAAQERIGQMTARIEELQTERVQLEVKVQEESRAAAKGMELLLLAQQNLSSAFKSLGVDGENGNHSQMAAEAVPASPEEKTEALEVAHAASSAG